MLLSLLRSRADEHRSRAVATLLLPEVRGRDPDLIYQQELEEAARTHQH